MVEKIETNVDRLLLVLIVKKKCSDGFFLRLNFFSFFKAKAAYLRPFLSALPFPKF